MAFNKKVSRRDFLKFFAAGATTLAFGSILGFSSLLSTNKNGGGGSGINGSTGRIPQAAAQTTSGTFVLGPNTGNISIHTANLTNGKIFYAAGSGFSSTYQNGPFHWNTFDPATGSITNHTVGKDIFCMGQAVLPNGKVLCAGGTLEYDVGDDIDGLWKGLDAAYEYDPDSNSLQEVQKMQHGRWYPYCIVLEDGKVLTIGGWDEWGSKNRLAEIYDPDSKSWSIKYDSISQSNTTYNPTYCVGETNELAPPGLPCYGQAGQGALSNLSLYPRALLMPTGLVAVAGQSKTTKTWNPQTGELKFAGNLSVERNYGNLVLLPLNNDAAEKGEILVCGGSNGAVANATTVVQLLTPKPPNYNSFNFQTITPCNFGRRHAPNAYLPDGNIIFFGGTNFQNELAGAYYNAEIFDPVTKSWTVVNGMTLPKIYHSTGILLLDGRVWLAGSQYAKTDWELRSEFFVPSYYNALRPTISSNPTVGSYGGTINIPTPNAADVQKVSLIKLGTYTHGFNSDMRFIWLQIQSKGSNNVTVSAPVNAKIAPPGYYMIHVLTSAGVPSIAKVIKIPGTASPPPGDTTPPSVDVTSPADAATISGPSSGVTVDVTGTASDESGGSGIQKVEVKVGSNPFKLATATGTGGSADWSTWSASDVVTSAGSTTILARATDNAGNTKDDTITVTVAFTGGGGTYTTIYSQAGTNSYMTMNTGGNHRAGEIMTSASVLIGNSIKKLTVILKKAGNPTGTITVRVRKGTADSDGIIFGTIQATTLTTTDQTFTLEAPTSHTFAANDKVLVEWAGTGTSTDQVLVKRHNYTDPAASFDGINTKQSHKVATSTGYSSYSNADIAGVWSKLEGSPPPGDTTPPSVDVTSPADAATISGPSSGVTVDVTGTASDESGGSGIQKVEVKVGSNPFKLATATGTGGSADWSTWSASDVVTSAGSTTILARATDNAGNTKDDTITVTVTFTGSGTYTTIYSQAGTNSYMTMNTGGNHRAGEIMTSASVLIGNSIKKLTVILKKAGNPTGTITVRVRKGTADSDGIIFGTIQATTLTTTDQTFTLEAPTSHTFAANDKVLVEWAGTGTSTDQVLVKRHNYTDPAASFDGINTKQSHKLATSTGYSSSGNADIAGQWSKLE